MLTKWRELIEEMDPEVFWALPPEVRVETLVEVDGHWIRIDRFQDDGDLVAAMTKTEVLP